jgi:hypothetical protein
MLKTYVHTRNQIWNLLKLLHSHRTLLIIAHIGIRIKISYRCLVPFIINSYSFLREILCLHDNYNELFGSFIMILCFRNFPVGLRLVYHTNISVSH